MSTTNGGQNGGAKQAPQQDPGNMQPLSVMAASAIAAAARPRVSVVVVKALSPISRK